MQTFFLQYIKVYNFLNSLSTTLRKKKQFEYQFVKLHLEYPDNAAIK